MACWGCQTLGFVPQHFSNSETSSPSQHQRLLDRAQSKPFLREEKVFREPHSVFVEQAAEVLLQLWWGGGAEEGKKLADCTKS